MNATAAASPSLLVLTPTLGTSPYLEASLGSVADLGLSVHHLLVCPAGETERLGRRFPHLTVVADQGRAGGLYGALNAGLAAADAAGVSWDWFTYLNDDDLLSPGFVELVRRHCRPERLASVAYGDILNVDTADRPLGRMTVERWGRRLPLLLQTGISPVGQQGMLFGAPVVRALGGYSLDYRLCADLDFWARAHALGFPFRYYPFEVGRFRLQPGQLSGDVALTRREQADITARLFPRRASALTLRLARAWYRLTNFPRYLERRRALGGRLPTSDALLASAGTGVAPAAVPTRS